MSLTPFFNGLIWKGTAERFQKPIKYTRIGQSKQ